MTTAETSRNGNTVPDPNKKCVLPFVYDGKEFTKCTNYDWVDSSDCSGCFWCGTQYQVTWDSGWGMCNDKCETQEYGV